jgi:hypothetical protein
MTSSTQSLAHQGSRAEGETDKFNGARSIAMKRKNKTRLGGGGGLSLEAFANAKSANGEYNPALIKKKREFYKNAKYVSKFKKAIKQEKRQNDIPHAIELQQVENKARDQREINPKKKANNKGLYSLKEVYEKRCEEDEKKRVEREAMIQAKKEQRERGEAQRRAAKEKFLKKTQYGQPVMKYKIEHLLQSIQGSTENSGGNTSSESPQCVGYLRRKQRGQA